MDLLLVDTRQVSVGMAEDMMALGGDMAQVLEVSCLWNRRVMTECMGYRVVRSWC